MHKIEKYRTRNNSQWNANFYKWKNIYFSR